MARKQNSLGQTKRVTSQFWLTFQGLKRPELKMWFSVWWLPDTEDRKTYEAWFGTNEAWAIYDFFRWCIEHRGALNRHRDHVETWAKNEGDRK